MKGVLILSLTAISIVNLVSTKDCGCGNLKSKQFRIVHVPSGLVIDGIKKWVTLEKLSTSTAQLWRQQISGEYTYYINVRTKFVYIKLQLISN